MTPKLIATYAVRDEPHALVSDLMANLAEVDEVVAVLGNRGHRGGWGHEGQLRARQRQAIVRHHGWGHWVLHIDPDERLEDRAVRDIRAAISSAQGNEAFGLTFREMWTPTAYRIDGGWGDKAPRWRIYRLTPGRIFRNKPIHCGVIPPHAPRVVLDARLYHLKMIEPANREARRQAYLEADPHGRHQPRGGDWGHLVDEAGLMLEDIPSGRGFHPPYELGSYRFTVPGAPSTSP